MSEYIHQDDAYEWVDNKRIEFAEQDFAKVQAERDEWKRIAEMYFVPFHEGGCPASRVAVENNRRLVHPRSEQCDCGHDAYMKAIDNGW
jgi:hypothetical protein